MVTIAKYHCADRPRESIMALTKAVSALRMGATVPIECAVRTSKTNGLIERCIGTLLGQVPTHEHFVESTLGKRIEVGAALFSWLVYCTETLN